MMTRFRLLPISLLAAAASVSAVASPASAEDFSRAEIEQIVHDYLMAHPEVILEAVQALQARQEAEAAARAAANLAQLRDDIFGGPATMIAGNPDGDVTLVEFFDYRCGYCRRVAPDVLALIQRDSGVRFAMKEFPILGEESVYASRAAIAAAAQDMYWEMHLALLNFRGTYDEDSIRAIAADLGMDPDRLVADMASSQVDAVINRNYELAQALGINGTSATPSSPAPSACRRCSS
jgi:protein-disulfide isomerase